MKLGMYICN